MKNEQISEPTHGSAEAEWNLMLVAMSAPPPAFLVKELSRSIVARGGWVLRHGKVSEVCADIDFEFPRGLAIEVYALLVAAGVELSRAGHQQLTELCHCTGQLDPSRSSISFPARVNLSVYTLEAGREFLGIASGGGARTAHEEAA